MTRFPLLRCCCRTPTEEYKPDPGSEPNPKRRKLGPSGTSLSRSQSQKGSFIDVLERLKEDAGDGKGACLNSYACP